MNDLTNYLKKHKINFLYHATYFPALESIKDFGLGANPSERINAWEGLSKNIVYLAHSPELASSFADSADNPFLPTEWLYQIVVLEISLDDLDLSYLEFDSNNQMEEPDRTFQYRQIIPWKNLRLLD